MIFAKEGLFDKEVIGKSGTVIGKVKDVIIDTNDWHVSAIQVELEGDVAETLHMKKRIGSTQHPISVNQIQGVGDKVVLRADVSDLPKLVTSPGGEQTKESGEQQAPSPPGNASATVGR